MTSRRSADADDTQLYISFSFIFSPFSLYISPLSFTPPLLFLKDVSKKLSYRWQNALSIIKTHKRNTVRQSP